MLLALLMCILLRLHYAFAGVEVDCGFFECFFHYKIRSYIGIGYSFLIRKSWLEWFVSYLQQDTYGRKIDRERNTKKITRNY